MATPSAMYSGSGKHLHRALAGLIGTALLVFHSAALAETATLAVAANFTGTMNRLAPLFEQQTGHQLRISYGSTGKLYAQIRHRAPFDAFMAADRERPQLLEQQGLAVAGTGFDYAEGRLALWSRTPDLFTDGTAWLARQPERLAIGNPKTAPYGIAAMEVLQNLGLAQALRPALVSGDSIAQTFQFVATGNAVAGFVALAQTRAWKEEGSLWLVPNDLHTPIRQQAVLLGHGEDNPAARAWMLFLASEPAQAIIREDGYDIPEQPNH